MSQSFKQKFLAKFLTAFSVIFLLSLSLIFDLFTGINHQFTDSLFTLNEPSDQIVIVAVDEKTTLPPPQGLGRFSQWSVTNFSKLLEILDREEAKVITVDILFNNFSETVAREKILLLEDQTEDLSKEEQIKAFENFIKTYKNPLRHPDDETFSQTLAKLDQDILIAALDITSTSLIPPIAKYADNTTLALANTYADEDGIIRVAIPHFQVGDASYDDLAVASVKKYLNQDQLDLPIQNNRLLVNFFADPYSYPMISFVDVMKGNYPANYFKDKIVLVGVTNAKLVHDEHYTPRSDLGPMSGIEFRANEIQTILDGKFLKNQSKPATIATIAVISTALVLAINYLSITLSLLLTLAAIGLYTLAAHYFYRQGLILNMIYPYLAIVLAYLASWVYKYFISDRHKRELKSAFGRYVSKDLVEQISKNPDMVKLGGETKEVSVFFSDIKSSTTLSEQIPIEQWVAQINEYFTVMEDVLMRSGGTLDKYEGDAIMGFWNAPIDQPDHVSRAYAAALQMLKSLRQLHQKWQSEGKPLIEIRIGLNTGPAIVGNFGSHNRLDYTVMGDTVNTASRLESAANKAYGTAICVAGNTQPPAEFTLRELDLVLLPGKKDPVKIYELIGLSNSLSPETQALLASYANGLASYRNKNWQDAITHFQQNPQDPPSQIMLKRCEILAQGAELSGLDLETMVFAIEHK